MEAKGAGVGAATAAETESAGSTFKWCGGCKVCKPCLASDRFIDTLNFSSLPPAPCPWSRVHVYTLSTFHFHFSRGGEVTRLDGPQSCCRTRNEVQLTHSRARGMDQVTRALNLGNPLFLSGPMHVHPENLRQSCIKYPFS